MNLPNYITLTRIAAIPLLIWILCTSRFSGEQSGEREILASAVFILASITDGIDGYLARRRGQITTMGMLLDPLADKLLIAAAFITLVQFNPALVPAWMAVVIIGREFLVSGLRSIAASEGFTIQASELGKFKMLVQIISVVAVILARRWHDWPVYGNLYFPGALDCVDSPSGSWFCFRWFRRSTTSWPSGRGSTASRKSGGAGPSSSPGGENAMSKLSEKPSVKHPMPRATRAAPGAAPPEFSLETAPDSAAHRAPGDSFCSGAPAFSGRATCLPGLAEPRGVFTTLYCTRRSAATPGEHQRELRGCVGYAMPIAPLYRAVAETARAAAFEDSRFLPVTEGGSPSWKFL